MNEYWRNGYGSRRAGGGGERWVGWGWGVVVRRGSRDGVEDGAGKWMARLEEMGRESTRCGDGE